MNYTIVLIPGLLSDEFVWSALQKALPAGVKVVVAHTTKDDSIEAMASRALEDFSGSLLPIGHSMGGRVAMEIAHRAPQRTVGMVLANTGSVPLQPGELEKRNRVVELGRQNFAELVNQWLPPMVAQDVVNTPLYQSLYDMAMRFSSDVHTQQLQALINRPDAGAYLHEIACPVLLIAAENDGWSPVAQHKQMAELLQDSELQVIPGAGHFAPVDAGEQFALIVLDWMQGRDFV